MSNSQCCVECFHDDTIKKIITGYQYIGRCHYCNANRVATIKLEALIAELSSTLEGLSDMLDEDDDGEMFIDILDNDFRVFAKETNISRIKSDLLSDFRELFEKKYKSVNTSEMHEQWIEFKNEILHKNRFFPQTPIYQQAFLRNGELYTTFQQLIEQLNLPLHPLEEFYRGRISSTVLPHSQMGKPPSPSLATLGRANPYGISYLYLAQTESICIKEIRPNNGDTISIAKFCVNKALNVIDLRTPRENISFLSLSSTDYTDILKLVSLLETFANELALPVLPNNSQKEYIPTQFITEFFKTHGNKDGIIFNSSYGEGFNIVLFDDAHCYCDTSTPVSFIKIRDISFQHEPN
ncbi:RES domain-containing protein [Acinetobacter shaoyimingii]|uniref:RES family NAD+ phosphorylase n=1 Tax=Acinetobacter shaoyimingii TaxID=2715164 RepID=A0A6G8RRW2_9GAMM|nr:RES domain-containing protein [Acinetobacter shaoyimingii]QIO04709.1 RES family NAD+ phosphorylase [Acinetobacter shaoyimingii]